MCALRGFLRGDGTERAIQMTEPKPRSRFALWLWIVLSALNSCDNNERIKELYHRIVTLEAKQ